MRKVTVDPPTRERIAPKWGMVSPVKSTSPTTRVRRTIRFQLKSVREGKERDVDLVIDVEVSWSSGLRRM